VERLIKQLETEKEAYEQASKGGAGKTQTLTSHNQPVLPKRFTS